MAGQDDPKPPGKLTRGGSKDKSSLAEHLLLVAPEERTRVADILAARKIRTFDDITDLAAFIMSELARGSMSAETATVLGAYLELMFTTVAAKGRDASNQRAANLLGQVLDAAKSSPEPRAIAATYSTNAAPRRVVDVEVVPATVRK